jgi:hypothetical protein
MSTFPVGKNLVPEVSRKVPEGALLSLTNDVEGVPAGQRP